MSLDLSICIPTHHGRADPLRRLLNELADQAAGRPDVQVCVSDNASEDATQEVLRRMEERFGEQLVHRRNDRNVGFAANLLRVSALADGRFIWFLGSDDYPVPGAVERMLELVRRHPTAAGVSHAFLRRGGPELDRVVPPVGDASWPPYREETVVTGADRIADELGIVTMYLTCNAVANARWREIVERERDAILDADLTAQMYAMARVSEAHPEWVWCPEHLVRCQADTVFLDETVGPEPVRQWALLIRQIERLWATLYGRGSARYRAVMNRWHSAAQYPSNFYWAKRRPDHGLRHDLALLLAFFPRYRWSEAFREQTLPILLRTGRSLRSPTSGADAIPPSPEITAEIPPVVYVGYQPTVAGELRNPGPGAYTSRPPHSFFLTSRWSRADGTILSEGPARWPVVPDLEAGGVRRFELPVAVPEEPGEYELTVCALAENLVRFDELDPATAVTRTVTVRQV